VADAVVVERVSKAFRRRVERPRRFSEVFVHGWRRRRRPEVFWALRDVSLRLAQGRMLGVIGRNGAGKSTLLRLVGGVGRPTEGRVETHGVIRAILDLGSTFQRDLTGRENVFLSGVTAGLTRREVKERLASIVAFAELEQFVDNPVRTYSGGMQTRLAFSVAVHTDPEILLVDEVLAVGDLAFQQKCLDRIQEFKNQGCAILLVSHETPLVEDICDEVLWLENGRVAAIGDPKAVVQQYIDGVNAETRHRIPVGYPPTRTLSGRELRLNENRFGSLEMEIVDVRLVNARNEPIEEIEPGETVSVEIEFDAPKAIKNPHFCVTISNEDGSILFDAMTERDGEFLDEAKGRARIGLQIERLDLSGGMYYVDVGVYERGWAYAYDRHWHVYPLRIRSSHTGRGILSIRHRWFVGEKPLDTDRVSKLEAL